MHEHGKSDSSKAPEKLSNKSVPTYAERVEGSELAKSNSFQQNKCRTQGRENLQSALERIRQAAIRDRRCLATIANSFGVIRKYCIVCIFN